MSVPPSFSDLGKAARDIFSKGFSKYQSDKMCIFVCHSSSVTLQFSGLFVKYFFVFACDNYAHIEGL